jgi:hypothetical protein
MAVTAFDAKTALVVIDLQHGIVASHHTPATGSGKKGDRHGATASHGYLQAGRNRDVPGDHRPARQGPRMSVAAAQLAHG